MIILDGVNKTMTLPARVTILDSSRIIIEIGNEDEKEKFLKMGFKKSNNYNSVYGYRSDDKMSIFGMCERLRDMGIPFSTDRTGGADYAVETFRSRGFLKGKFKRINFFGNDNNENASFVIEEF